MRRFQSILYVTRGTADQSDALQQALSLARNNAAALHALVVSPPLPKAFTEYGAGFETTLVDRLKGSIASAQAVLKMNPDEVHVEVDVECGDRPAARIVRRALRNAHDMLIKDAEAADRSAGLRALDMELLRLCPCPVWLCRPLKHSDEEMSIAVAVDPQSAEPAGRDLAIQLLRLSRSLTDAFHARLNVISCWDFEFEEYLRHQPWMKLPQVDIDRSVLTAERDHRAALDAVIEDAGIAGPLKVHHQRGRPDQTILRLVDDLHIDLLVMGTVARAGIPGLFIGNTAENVMSEIRCSLLALKPNGFVSPVRAY